MTNSEEKKGGFRGYEVLYAGVLLILLVVGIFVNRPHRVGVLDIDRALRDLGMAEEFEADMKELQQVANTAARSAQNRYQEQRRIMEERMRTVSEEERPAAQGAIMELDAKFQGEVRGVLDESRRRQGELQTTYRERLQPHINQVAHKRRLHVIVARNPQLVYMRSTIDVTDDVVAAAGPASQ